MLVMQCVIGWDACDNYFFFIISLEMGNSYQLFFEWAVVLVCYSFIIGKLVIALKHREYDAVKIQLLLLLITTVIVVGIYFI